MSNIITVSALNMPKPSFRDVPQNFASYEAELKRVIKKFLDKALADSPDLIVFPEAASRYARTNGIYDVEKLKEYYKYLGTKIEEFLMPIAVDNNVNIAYSAIRYAYPERKKPFRNSTTYIGRDGTIKGIYDKNYLTVAGYDVNDCEYGTEANLVGLDFGNVASAICFDLNFDELLNRYAPQKPDLTVFSSMYHGGLRQAQWAYSTQSHFIGAVCGQQCTVLNPCGEVIAASSNYTHHVSAKINLDCKLCHLDENVPRFNAAKEKYKSALEIHVPSYIGVALLSCNSPDLSVNDIIKEFGIETLDEYFDRSIVHREKNI
jgi:predicted amidohydrolase